METLPTETDPPMGGTTYQRVRDRIRRDIISGRIAPGSRLKIADLALLYGLSQMPVREALQQLQGEGLVTLSPNRGASVRRMDARFIRNLFDIREALEGFLTFQAAPCVTADLIDRLRAIQRRYDALVTADDRLALESVNREFHEAILGVTGNAEAMRLLDQHTAIIGVLRSRHGYAPGRLAIIQQEHWSLIEALERRDAAAAQAIHALHVRRAGDDMLAMMQKDQA
ncbi:GntR family transcriptional regulator [Falsiroseomonas sp. E2-1-a20]|uniref:GntR family transcriptional regulator n=1 Tax=Falsiroseomonas sp. E2-1-a20 TaxID=3239300 RepID=UPI003F385107